ncbi:MAG: hypothetical protein WC891_04575 [Actinomycetota bacterium]
MTENNVSQEVLNKVKEAAGDNGLSCPEARKLADDLGVAPKVIGDACNQIDVKIKNCALGCF